MIDTITLTIPQNHYITNHPEWFNPPLKFIDSDSYTERLQFIKDNHGYRKFTQNMSSKYRSENGLVYPNLTIHERLASLHSQYTRGLYITCSLPHILNGQSFDEIQEKDFDQIVTILKSRLQDMGILVTTNEIINATVQCLHYCVNIKLDSYSELKISIEKLSKLNVNSRMENNMRIYGNDGLACRYRSEVFEVVFYSKYYDILEPKGRKVSKKVSLQEKQMIEKISESGQIPAVLRYELRMNNVRSIRRRLNIFTKVDQEKWTFKQVFSDKIAKQVLLGYWQKLLSFKGNIEYLTTVLPQEVSSKIIDDYGKNKKVFEARGLYITMLDIGPKDLKKQIITSRGRPHWISKATEISKFSQTYGHLQDTLIAKVNNSLNSQLTLEI